MRELTTAQIENVSGSGGAPSTAANAASVGIIVGSLGAIATSIAAGSPVGPAGMIISGIMGGWVVL